MAIWALQNGGVFRSSLILSYAKLESLGFGGRVKTLIQSMYYNDCVRVRIAGSLPAPLWFTKGV